MLDLLGEAMDDVDGVIDADADRQRGDERRDHVVGNVEQGHRSEHPDQDKQDR